MLPRKDSAVWDQIVSDLRRDFIWSFAGTAPMEFAMRFPYRYQSRSRRSALSYPSSGLGGRDFRRTAYTTTQTIRKRTDPARTSILGRFNPGSAPHTHALETSGETIPSSSRSPLSRNRKSGVRQVAHPNAERSICHRLVCTSLRKVGHLQ